jgi:hypothetical protein
LNSIDEDVKENNNEYPFYKDLYTEDQKYGIWFLNRYKFNVDKRNLKMIDSTGEISTMFIPTTPKDVIDDSRGFFSNKYNRKVYFTTQGAVVSDNNCILPKDNLSLMTMNQCNGTAIEIDANNIQANSDGLLELNASSDHKSGDKISKRIPKWFKKGETLVLKETDEPWFLNSDIVGKLPLKTDLPYKVTGVVHLIGTNYGDVEEREMPYASSCVKREPIIGYSRADEDAKCLGLETPQDIEPFGNANNADNDNNNDANNDDQDLETTTLNYNNIIICIILFIIIVLLLIKRK